MGVPIFWSGVNYNKLAIAPNDNKIFVVIGSLRLAKHVCVISPATQRADMLLILIGSLRPTKDVCGLSSVTRRIVVFPIEA